jgi:hypothetical protein
MSPNEADWLTLWNGLQWSHENAIAREGRVRLHMCHASAPHDGASSAHFRATPANNTSSPLVLFAGWLTLPTTGTTGIARGVGMAAGRQKTNLYRVPLIHPRWVNIKGDGYDTASSIQLGVIDLNGSLEHDHAERNVQSV